ncbi:MAG: translation elongation factor [Frankiales bacterium]|nr:translation elongation factor [Frankiales bacterium]
MHVIATAGHVDHGKSTLVRALTGMEPDRWAEEKRRGMTIDLGYAWGPLPSGEVLGFVDVPGHQRFLGNMLAGLGPAPAVLVVVAADEGWRRQSGEHLAAVQALGVRHGLLAVTRSDLADPGAATAEALDHLRASTLGDVEAVAVSGRTGAGLEDLRAALDRLVHRLPLPETGGPVRLWVDRAFTVRGSGTVVTGTLSAGTLRTGQTLLLRGREVRVRGLQSLGEPHDEVAAVARVAVNLRGVEREEVDRGDTLLTPGAWHLAATVDVRLSVDPRDLPSELVLHAGSTAVAVRLRPLGPDTVRLSLRRPLPLRAGDRALLRDPGLQAVAAGVLVLDADPPVLRRRGAAAGRAAALAGAGPVPDLLQEVHRRGAVRRGELEALGVPLDRTGDVVSVGEWLVDPEQWASWVTALLAVVDRHGAVSPLEGGITLEAARHAVGVPDVRLLSPLAALAGLEATAGRLRRLGEAATLGSAEEAVAAVERRLAAAPWAAPEADDLAELGLDARALAAAERVGRLLRLGGDVVLLPDGPARAMRVLAALPQPFTLSQARVALGTTRRVAVPLLEHLDGRGWTRRLDGQLREVRRPAR